MIRPFAAIKRIVTNPAKHHIIAAAAIQTIITGTTINIIIACAADQYIIPTIAKQTGTTRHSALFALDAEIIIASVTTQIDYIGSRRTGSDSGNSQRLIHALADHNHIFTGPACAGNALDASFGEILRITIEFNAVHFVAITISRQIHFHAGIAITIAVKAIIAGAITRRRPTICIPVTHIQLQITIDQRSARRGRFRRAVVREINQRDIKERP